MKTKKRWTGLAILGLIIPIFVGCTAAPQRIHIPASQLPSAGATIATGSSAPFSAAVLMGNTLYVSGGIDVDATTGKLGTSAEESARFVLDGLRHSVERSGMTMDDLVWVQVFCTDLSYYKTFNAIYRTYFHDVLPARAFLGVDHLLSNAHFEVMGIGVKSTR